jgi:hypothetical protein
MRRGLIRRLGLVCKWAFVLSWYGRKLDIIDSMLPKAKSEAARDLLRDNLKQTSTKVLTAHMQLSIVDLESFGELRPVVGDQVRWVQRFGKHLPDPYNLRHYKPVR